MRGHQKIDKCTLLLHRLGAEKIDKKAMLP